MKHPPRVFIGSASETEEFAKEIGKALKKALKNQIDLRNWRDVFTIGDFSLRSLQRAAAECDFAVFVWGMSDATVSRGRRSGSPRDNVVYEAGLFAGALGARRVFVVHAKKTKIPTDYLGVTTARFDPKNPDVDDIVRPIHRAIKQLGKKPAARLLGHWWQLVLGKKKQSVVSFVHVKPDDDGRSVSMGGHAWNERGQLIARWDTVATQFDEDNETLHYSWEGKHPTQPGAPLYFGIGTIFYGQSPIGGDFTATRRHQGDDQEPTAFKSVFYRRAETEHVAIMAGADPKAWKRLIAKMLKHRESYYLAELRVAKAETSPQIKSV